MTRSRGDGRRDPGGRRSRRRGRRVRRVTRLRGAARRGRSRGRRPRADRAAAALQPARQGALRRDQPGAHRGHAQPDRRRPSPPARAASSARASPSPTARRAARGPGRGRRRCSSTRPRPFGDGVPRGRRDGAHGARRAGLEASCCATAGSTGPAPTTPPTGRRPRTYAGAASPSIGSGAGLFSFIHVDDAAAATVAAVERGRARHLQRRRRRAGADARVAAGLRRGDRREAAAPRAGLARAADRGPLRRQMATRLPGASNAKAKRELEWTPRPAELARGLSRRR